MAISLAWASRTLIASLLSWKKPPLRGCSRIETAPESSAPRLQQLNFLLQLAQMLHRAAALEDILIAVVDSALQLSGADRGILFLMDESDRLSLRLMRQR